MTLPVLLAWLVVLVAFPLNWYVAIRLALLSGANPDVRVLRAQLMVYLCSPTLTTRELELTLVQVPCQDDLPCLLP